DRPRAGDLRARAFAASRSIRHRTGHVVLRRPGQQRSDYAASVLEHAMKMARAPLALGVAALMGASGCTLNLDRGTEGQLVKNQCGSNGDCGVGTCWNGMCVANQGLSSGVLIEVTPPTSVG